MRPAKQETHVAAQPSALEPLDRAEYLLAREHVQHVEARLMVARLQLAVKATAIQAKYQLGPGDDFDPDTGALKRSQGSDAC